MGLRNKLYRKFRFNFLEMMLKRKFLLIKNSYKFYIYNLIGFLRILFNLNEILN